MSCVISWRADRLRRLAKPPASPICPVGSKGYSEVRRDGGTGGWIDTLLRLARSGYFIV
jgi:hypothetical protein